MGSDDPIVEMRDGTALTSLALRGLGQAFPRSRLTLGQVKGRMRANEEGNPSKSVRPSAGDALVRRRPATRAPGRPVVRVRPPDKVPDDLIEPTMSRQTS